MRLKSTADIPAEGQGAQCSPRHSLQDPVGTTERLQRGAVLGERELRWVSRLLLRAGAGRGVGRAQGCQDPRSHAAPVP